MLGGALMGWPAAIARVAERIGIVEWLNTRLAWDPAQCRLSPGVRLFALMVAFLVDPCALYRMSECFEPLDCKILFGPSVHAQDLTDDALGRALLKLHAAQPAQIFAELSARAIAAYDLPPTDAVHGDTTTLTLYGEYPDAEPEEEKEKTPASAATAADPSSAPPETAVPRRGYNKDGHPDAKQLVLGAVTRPDGIPVVFSQEAQNPSRIHCGNGLTNPPKL